MLNNKTAFTLVEMIVALAVSAIIIAATYASYDIVKTQYKKNLDVAEMHQSGRGIMQMIERDIRMAGFNYIDKDAKTTYGPISKPLIIKDSGNNCCDEVTVIYDYVEDVLDWKGRLVSSSVNRIKVHYWAEAYTSKKGDRYRLYKQKDILGKNNALLDKPINGIKEVMADYIEDLQFINIVSNTSFFAGSQELGTLRSYDRVNKIWNPQEIFTNQFGAAMGVLALAFGSDDTLYVAGYDYGTLRSYDTVSKKWGFLGNLIKYGSHRGIFSLAFGSDGTLYVGGSKAFSSYDPIGKTWVALEAFRTDRREVNTDALAFGPDGLLYVGSMWNADSFNLRTYNPATKKYGSGLDSHMFRYKLGRNVGVRSLTFCPDGLLYVGSTSGLIRSFDPVTKVWGDNVIFTNKNGYVASVDSLACENDVLYAGSEGLEAIRPFNLSTEKWGDEIKFTNYRGQGIGVRAMAVKTKKTGQESLVSINLTLRAKNEYGKLRQFTKKDYHGGNYKLDKTDRYKRDTFSSSVLARNLML